MAIESHYNVDLTIVRRTYGQSATGAKTAINTTIGTARGRIRNLSGTEVVKLGRDSDRDWVRIYTSGEFQIEPLDLVTVSGSDGNMNGSYEVRRRSAPQTSQVRHHWELDSVRYT
jgi:hypothetical protein